MSGYVANEPYNSHVMVAGGGGPPPFFFRDDFAVPDTVDLGPDWVQLGDLAIVAERMVYTNTLTTRGRVEHDIGTPNMSITSDITGVGLNCQILARMSGGPIANDLTYYAASYNNSIERWQLHRVIAGTPTLIAQSTVIEHSTPFKLNVIVENSGADVRIRVIGFDLQRIDFLDTNAAKILTGNYAGVFMSGTTKQIEYFECGAF